MSLFTEAMRCFCFFSVTFSVLEPRVCAWVTAALHRTTPLRDFTRTSSEKLPPWSQPLASQSRSGITSRKSSLESSSRSAPKSRLAALLTQTGRKPSPSRTMLSALPSSAERISSALWSMDSLPSMPIAAASTTASVWSCTASASPDILIQPMTSPSGPCIGAAEQVQPWWVRQ